MSGKIELMYGPMFSQKTMWLVHICLGKMADLGKKCLLILHSYDIRPEISEKDSFSTHGSTLRRKHEKIDIIKTSDLSNISVDNYEYIGVDEGQFFSADDMNIVIGWFLNGKKIFVSALDGDANRNFFGHTYLLIPYIRGGDIHKSTASVCMRCLDQGIDSMASYTYKHLLTSSGNEGPQIDPGADEKYVSVCGTCYHQFKNYQ